jgi:hypothetical protein
VEYECRRDQGESTDKQGDAMKCACL